MADILSNMERAIETYRARNKSYGDSYRRSGAVMAALFPEGVTLRTARDWNRFGVLMHKVGKLTRYVTDPYAGHLDSIHDDGVYSFMLEELDSDVNPIQLKLDLPVDIAADGKQARDNLVSTAADLGVRIDTSFCEHVWKALCSFLPAGQQCTGEQHVCGFLKCAVCHDITTTAKEPVPNAGV